MTAAAAARHCKETILFDIVSNQLVFTALQCGCSAPSFMSVVHMKQQRQTNKQKTNENENEENNVVDWTSAKRHGDIKPLSRSLVPENP